MPAKTHPLQAGQLLRPEKQYLLKYLRVWALEPACLDLKSGSPLPPASRLARLSIFFCKMGVLIVPTLRRVEVRI